MSLRNRLERLEVLLSQARQDPMLLRTPSGLELAQFLVETCDRIERLPQLNLIRAAVIEIRNLVVSLRRPEHSETLHEELAAVLDTVRELIADPLFGFSIDELRAQVDDALLAKGVHSCPICNHADLRVDLVYALTRPFLSDPALAPSQVPSALVVCRHCGFSALHELAILGVV